MNWRVELFKRFQELDRQNQLLKTAFEFLSTREKLGIEPMTLDKALKIIEELMKESE